MYTLLEMGLANAVTAAVVAVVAFGLSRLCRRRPAFVHGLWLVVFLKLVTPPLFGVRLPVSLAWAPQEPAPVAFSAPETVEDTVASEPVRPLAAVDDSDLPGESAAPGIGTAGPTTEPVSAPLLPAPAQPLAGSWQAVVGPVWLAGSLLWFGWMALHIVRFRRVLGHAWQAPADVQRQAQELAARLGLSHCPRVWLVPGSVSPMLWAAGWSARLLFPAGLLERLDRDQRASLLAHELAHLRRRDHWVRLLELAAIGLYWWHPVVWWARRELHEVEEQCCDAWAVWALRGASRPYALALLQTVEFFSGSRSALPAAASGIGTVPHLRRRLVMIMNGTTPKSLSRLGSLATLGLGALLLLPTLPLDAQAPPRPEPPADEQYLQQQQQKLQAELQKVQAEIKKRALERVLERNRPSIWLQDKGDFKVSSEALTLKAQASKFGPEVRQAMAEVERARANLVAAEQKLRAAVRRAAQDERNKAREKAKDAAKERSRAQEFKNLKRGSPDPQEDRLRRLEQRLDRLQQMLERLERGRSKGSEAETENKLGRRLGANS